MEQATRQSGPNVLNMRRRVDERALDKEEEDYFNEDSDEEDSTSASMSRPTRVRAQPDQSNGSAANITSSSPRAGGLVDYEDDEDDDKDYKPPPRIKSEEDDESGLELRLKRKLSTSKQGSHLVKKQKLLGKNPKSKERVFATFSSTISQTKKTTNAAANTQDTETGPNTCHVTNPIEDKGADNSGAESATKMAINGS